MNVYEIESVNIEAMEYPKAIQTLRKGCDFLENIGQKYWLSAGTLLGLHRNKGFIPHDTDIDVEILGDADIDTILEQIPFKPVRIQEHNGRYSQLAFIDDTDVIFDIYIFYEHGDHLINYNEHGILFYPKEMFQELTTINFNHHRYACPDPDRYCEFRYGQSWKIPKTSKDTWSEDASNLIPFTQYQRIREFLEQLIDIDNSDELTLMLGDVARQNDDIDYALTCYERIPETSDLADIAISNRISFLATHEKDETTPALADDYLKKNPQSLRVQLALFEWYTKTDNREKASEYFDPISRFIISILPEKSARTANIQPPPIAAGFDHYSKLFKELCDARLQHRQLSQKITLFVLREYLYKNPQLPADLTRWLWNYLQHIEFCNTNISFGRGFYGAENDSRWMGTTAEITIKASRTPTYVLFDISCNPGDHYRKFPFRVHISRNDQLLNDIRFSDTQMHHGIHFKIGPSDQNVIIKLNSEASFVPADIGLNEDSRQLSVKLQNLLITDDTKIYKSLLYYQSELHKTNENYEQEYQNRTRLETEQNECKSELEEIHEELIGKTKTLYEYEAHIESKDTVLDYEKWLALNALSETDKQAMLSRCSSFSLKPKISILTPVYNVDPQWLNRCVQSVMGQLYTDWELLLVDDGSSNTETLQALKDLENRDPRIRVTYRDKNGGISAATNTALFASRGEYAALLDNDDELSVDALYEVVNLINQHPEADYIYSDEDKMGIDGKRSEPFFKPDWSPDLLRSYAYTNHLSVFRTELLKKLNGLRSDFDGAQDYDLTLRVAAETNHIFHIPKILYHWRKIPGSAADVVDAKSYALNRAQNALKEHTGTDNVFTAPDAPGCFRVRYPIKGHPLVSILLPIRGQKTKDHAENLLYQCLRSVVNLTDYQNYEIIVGYNNTIDPEIETFCKQYSAKTLNYPLQGSFNFAQKINYMATHSEGDHLVIFNDDLEVISGDWLTALLELSQQETIGAVGSKLLYPDVRLQHIGVIMGINGYPAHVYHQARPAHPGYFAHANLIRNYAAVTGAGMMVKHSLFDRLGGFSEQFATDYNDTDFCLRLMQEGYRNVYTPFALFYHHESTTLTGGRLNWKDTANFRQKWSHILQNDPYYNPNLTKKYLNYRIDV